MKYQIDAEMCGDEATEDIARRVVEILNDAGWDCEYAECADNHGEKEGIPDEEFYAAVDKAAKEVVSEYYEAWLVPNGRLVDFRRGMTGAGYPDACSCWGKFETLDEVRDIYAEWAEENFDRENGPSEGYETEEERDKAREAEVARARETLSLEWHDDLKWVKTRKMAERRDGEVEVVEVL